MKTDKSVVLLGYPGSTDNGSHFYFCGGAFISKFHWIIYSFGSFLVFTGIKMLFHKDEETNIINTENILHQKH